MDPKTVRLSPSRIISDWLAAKQRRDEATLTAVAAEMEMELLAHELSPLAPIYGRKEVHITTPGETWLVSIEQESGGGRLSTLIKARAIDSAYSLEWPADVARVDERPDPDRYLVNADEAMADAAEAWQFRTSAEAEEWAADDVVSLADPQEVHHAVLVNNGVVSGNGNGTSRYGDDF